jgi:hypothetical protein
MSSLNYDCMEIIINKCDFSTLRALHCIWMDEYLSDEWEELLHPCVSLYRNMKAERKQAEEAEIPSIFKNKGHSHYPNPHGYGF